MAVNSRGLVIREVSTLQSVFHITRTCEMEVAGSSPFYHVLVRVYLKWLVKDRMELFSHKGYFICLLWHCMSRDSTRAANAKHFALRLVLTITR